MSTGNRGGNGKGERKGRKEIKNRKIWESEKGSENVKMKSTQKKQKGSGNRETFLVSPKVKRKWKGKWGKKNKKTNASGKEKNQIQCFPPILSLTDLSTCLLLCCELTLSLS